jgi:hypothetical protein
MTKFPWKTTLAGAAILAATVYAYAQVSPGMHGGMGMHGQMSQGGMNGDMAQMHQQMTQGQGAQGGMHGHMGQGGMHGGMHGQQFGAAGMPTMPGQDAFGSIQEVVQILDADSSTDWSKVNIDALREHLIDMNEVTLHAAAATRVLDNGAAIKRMVPAHVAELREIGWNAKTDELPNGVKLTVTASEAVPLTKLKALGFMGVMVQGGHHQPHHLLMAKGEFVH